MIGSNKYLILNKMFFFSRKIVEGMNRHFPVLLARLRYFLYFGRKLNLHNPSNLNEKILWLSLYSDTSLWSYCADKYKVRGYVQEKGLGNVLTKLYGVWSSVKDINWGALPKSFILKTTNGCGTVFVVKNKAEIEIPFVESILEKWINRDVSKYTTEFHYRRIKPRIIAEELLTPSLTDAVISKSLIDYKIWCFNGVPDSFFVCGDRDSKGFSFSIYDLEWNCRNDAAIFNDKHKEIAMMVPKPKNLDKMLEIARKLSEDFPMVRVDLYNIDGHIYFGELTFTPYGGTITYYTQDELLRMGSKINLSSVSYKCHNSY